MLERTKKEMSRLKARVEELRRSFIDIGSGNGKVQRPEAIRELCREANITIDTFTRLVGPFRAGLWQRGWPAILRIGENQRNVSEMFRVS